MEQTLFQPGQYCGDYRIEQLLGAGGFAEVYRARCVKTHERVALKVLHTRHSENASAKEKMRAEAEFLSSVSHMNLVRVLGLGRHQGVMFMAMEYLEGKTLRAWMAENGGRFPLMQALYVAREIADGLGAAHELGVVHRDLKPENVFVTNERKIKVLDLGAAKFFGWNLRSTAPGRVIGTPLYMAPEHVRGLKVDGRADVYALGVLLYEMIGGHFLSRHRDAGMSKYEAAMMQITVMPVPLKTLLFGCPDDVSDMVAKAMEKDPGKRFESMSAFAKAIRDAQKQLKKTWGLKSTGQMSMPAPSSAAETEPNISLEMPEDDGEEDTTQKRRKSEGARPVSFVYEVDSGEALTQEQKPSLSQAISAFVTGAQRGRARRVARRALKRPSPVEPLRPMRAEDMEPTAPMQMADFSDSRLGAALASEELVTLPMQRLLVPQLPEAMEEHAAEQVRLHPTEPLPARETEAQANVTEMSAAGGPLAKTQRTPVRVGPVGLVFAAMAGMVLMWAGPAAWEQFVASGNVKREESAPAASEAREQPPSKELSREPSVSPTGPAVSFPVQEAERPMEAPKSTASSEPKAAGTASMPKKKKAAERAAPPKANAVKKAETSQKFAPIFE